MIEGLKWGEDLKRDCIELRRLENYGLYPDGYHDDNCLYCLNKTKRENHA